MSRAQPSTQHTLQFLSNALSQRGPSSLPYAEEVKWHIRQQLVALVDANPSLHIQSATFTHNDGRSVNLLQADGTIPMYYQGVTYNIPVVIWLTETYPRHPPCVYLAPTRDMIIKPGHPFVNPSGLVSIPYLQSWVFPSSNLVDLVRQLSQVFSRNPPLYTKQQSRPNPSPNPTAVVENHHHLSSSNSLNSLQSPSSFNRPAIPPRVYSSSPYGNRFPPSPQRPTDDPADVYRRNAVHKLQERISTDLASLRKSRELEMDGLFNAQAALRQREEQLSKGLREMLDEKEGLEQQLQIVLMNTDVLEGWVRDNEGKINKGNFNVDDVFEPCDALSKQMLDCSAADLAIEDVIYSLDKAVQEGVIPFDSYLKNIRVLSREQFFHRATAAKVRAAQMQAQVSSMAARASSYGL